MMSQLETIAWYEQRMGKARGNVRLTPLRSLLAWDGRASRVCSECLGVGLLQYVIPVPCQYCGGLGYRRIGG